MQEYAFATIKHGQMADRINEWAEKGFSVESWQVQGNSFFVLFAKWGMFEDDEEVSNSDQLWVELENQSERVALLEGALALKIRNDVVEAAEQAPSE